jgi:hypothetical protein
MIAVCPACHDHIHSGGGISDNLLYERKKVPRHLLSADRLSVAEVTRRAGVSRPAVWRWQERYAESGVDGLLGDKTRPPGKAPVPPATVARVLALTCAEPPGETTQL